MRDLIKQFEEVRKDFLETLERFPKERVEEVLFGKWSSKDAVAHFAGWDEYFTKALKLLKQNKDIPYWGNIDEFNNKSVNKAKNLSWHKVYKNFVKSGKSFIDEYKKLDKKLQEKYFWKDKKYTPLKFLKINIHHYEKTHLLKIKKKLQNK